MSDPTTTHLQRCLDRLHQGDANAREELLRQSLERLRALTRRMLVRFPNVRRWEETDDVLQDALLRIDQMLGRIEVASVRDYLRLAAANIRRVLLDLARHYDGPLGLGAKHNSPLPHGGETGGDDPAGVADGSSSEARQLAGWSEFHENVTHLANEEREVFDLLWYHGPTQDEAATLLEVSLSTVKRRWQSARLSLMEAFGGEPPF